jgi:hypothetical protein
MSSKLAVATGLAAALMSVPAPPAAAGTLAYPGMTIAQGGTRCTLAFIDTARRIGYSAGHCDHSSTVTDDNGNPIGVVMVSHDNRAGQTATSAADLVIDYETISINSGVEVTSLLGPALTRPIITQPGIRPAPGMVVCHRGEATGASCGEIDKIHKGWFTMKPGTLTSDHGDSGGPVYTYTDATGSQPVIVGILRGLNGNRTAAVSWPETLRASIYDAADIGVSDE